MPWPVCKGGIITAKIQMLEEFIFVENTNNFNFSILAVVQYTECENVFIIL